VLVCRNAMNRRTLDPETGIGFACFPIRKPQRAVSLVVHSPKFYASNTAAAHVLQRCMGIGDKVPMIQHSRLDWA